MRNAVRFDLLWVFEYFFAYLFLACTPCIAKTAIRMQTKRLFWIMLSQMQCEVSGCTIGCNSLWVHQAPCHLYGPGRDTKTHQPFSHLSKPPRHILTDYCLAPPQDFPSSRDTRPEIVIQVDSIGLLGPHVHLATNDQMLLTFRCHHQRVVSVHLAPILQWSVMMQIRALDRTVRVVEIRMAPASMHAVEVPVRVREVL